MVYSGRQPASVTEQSRTMKLILSLLAMLTLAVGYNYLIAEHGSDIRKAIHGPDVKATKRIK